LAPCLCWDVHYIREVRRRGEDYNDSVDHNLQEIGQWPPTSNIPEAANTRRSGSFPDASSQSVYSIFARAYNSKPTKAVFLIPNIKE
jgi:hypothetical protein